MDLSRALLKDFAKITNDTSDRTSDNIYVRGSVKTVGNKKYVKVDGSEGLTPISEVVDVDDDDRVLVSIENHIATIIGNFTYPPSARKEEEALNKAEDANNNANDAHDKAEDANNKAEDANNKADSAIKDAQDASSKAEEAKKDAQEAIDKSNEVKENLEDAKQSAQEAVDKANTALEEAGKAQTAVQGANEEIDRINGEVTNVKDDISGALNELEKQADEIQATKENMELNYTSKTETSEVEASLRTEISKKVGELQTTVEQNYAGKNDVVELEGKLQSQITQNAEGLQSVVSKTERLESDTEEAQNRVDQALSSAFDAQAAADQALEHARKSQEAADLAKENFVIAQNKATEAQKKADEARKLADSADSKLAEARTALAEAKQNLQDIIENGGSEEDIAAAEQKVKEAESVVEQALADATEAELMAKKAQDAADGAKRDAEEAQQIAQDAMKKAKNAKAVADKAVQAAKEAQEKVAALTKRITEAETAITQNSEAIELSAKKTEEIGDNLKNNYYNKTETDAKFKITNDSITSTVKKEVSTEIGKVKVGNMDLSQGKMMYSDPMFASGENGTSSYKTGGSGSLDWERISKSSDNPMTGTEYEMKCSSSGTITPANGGFKWEYNTRANAIFATRIITKIPKGYTLEFEQGVIGDNGTSKWLTSNEGTGKYTEYIMRTDTGPSGIFGATGFFYVKGQAGTTNNPLIWYVAYATTFDMTGVPDIKDAKDTAENAKDTANKAQAQADSNESRLSISESTIKQLSDSISMLVTDENGSSMMQQTGNGWTFNMGAIENTLNKATDELNNLSGTVQEANGAIENLNSLANDLAKKTAYIVMTTDESGSPCIELGKEGNAFKVRITNTSVDFMEGSSKIAYISNKSLYIEKAIIKDELQIGEGNGFVWKRRSNGNMGLRWVGGAK